MGCLPSYSWLLFLDSASSIPVAASSKLLRVTTIPLEQASAICYRPVPGVSGQDSVSRLDPSTWFSPRQPAETCYCLVGARLCSSLSENAGQALEPVPWTYFNPRHECHRLFHTCQTVFFPGGASGKEPTCQCRRLTRRGFNPWVRKIPWRRKW